MGGGGSNDNYQQQQQQLEAKKQAARDSLNSLFGYGPSSVDASGNVDRNAFAVNPGNGGGGVAGAIGNVTTRAANPTGYDEAGYNAAVQDATTAPGNRAARDGLYQTVRDNAFTAGKRKLDDQRDVSQRKLRFELFARGLNGGSEDVNQNAMLGRTYDQGVLDLGARADGAKADFRNSDEQTRLGLLQSIDNGMDAGSAISSAVNQMGVNSDRAAAAAQGTTLGDLFSNAGMLYDQFQSSLGQQAGQQAFDFFRRGNKGGATGTPASDAGGMVTSLGAR